MAPTVQDFGDVCVIEDDGSLVTTIDGTDVVDYVAAYKAFRSAHGDHFNFVTFVTDTENGMPPQGSSSWYQGVFNDIQGIGLGDFDGRAAYGSQILEGIIFLNQGHFGQFRYVMLQEQGHRWGSFVNYADTNGGADMNDHMLGGWAHWAAEFDDDKSPMDYDTFDWRERSTNFDRGAVTSDQRVYCNLDLYLMGLLEPERVGDVYLLSNLVSTGGISFTANKKRLTIDNFLWAEGARSPGVAQSPKTFRHAFVVLTGEIERVHDLAERVDELRRRFEQDFFEGTKRLARINTSLREEVRVEERMFVLWFGDEGHTNLGALNESLRDGWRIHNAIPMSGTGEAGPETPQSPFPYSRAAVHLQKTTTPNQRAIVLWFADDGANNLSGINGLLRDNHRMAMLTPLSDTGEHGPDTPQSPFPYSRALVVLERT